MELSEAFSPVRAIQHGLAAVQRAPATVLVGGFLIFLVDACSSGGGNTDVSQFIQEDQPPEVSLALVGVMLAALAVSIVIGIVAFLVKCWLLPGWIRAQRHVLQHGTDSFPVLFGGADAFGRILLWRLLCNVVLIGTFIVAAVPGGALMGLGFSRGMDPTLLWSGITLFALLVFPSQIYVALGVSLGDHAVSLEGLGPIEALDRSWELARGNRLTLFVFFLITGLFSLLGLLACCIGSFATRAIADVGTTSSYLLATTPGVDQWEIPREAGV